MPAAGAEAATGPLPHDHFVNPVGEGADPYVVRDGDEYWWCWSDGDRGITVSRSTSLSSPGARTLVWRAPATGPCSAEVWAPELHRLDGRWHIYFAASDGDNRNHRAFVLVTETDDPAGPYRLHGPLATADADGPDRWAIDMTILHHGGHRYAVWSGWPGAEETAQHLYLARLDTPTEVGPRVLISSPFDHPWEAVPGSRPGHGPIAINEAPQVLQRDGRTFVLFSASGAWGPTYTMGALELVGSDPAVADAWRKHPAPVLAPTPATPGVGHGLVVDGPDRAPWLVFHAKIDHGPSFRRAVHVQPVTDPAALPHLGVPLPAGRPVAVPSPVPQVSPPGDQRPGAQTDPVERSWDLRSAALPEGWEHFGHHQFLVTRPDGLLLGRVPEEPVNAYRSGEKVIVTTTWCQDVAVTADLELLGARGAAGVLLRASGAAVGHDAFRGYFLGYDATHRRLVISRHDGVGAVVLAARPVRGRLRRSIGLQVTARGPVLSVRWTEDPQAAPLEADDATFPAGAIGLRVDDTTARFTRLTCGRVRSG